MWEFTLCHYLGADQQQHATVSSWGRWPRCLHKHVFCYTKIVIALILGCRGMSISVMYFQNIFGGTHMFSQNDIDPIKQQAHVHTHTLHTSCVVHATMNMVYQCVFLCGGEKQLAARNMNTHMQNNSNIEFVNWCNDMYRFSECHRLGCNVLRWHTA